MKKRSKGRMPNSRNTAVPPKRGKSKAKKVYFRAGYQA